MNDIKILKKIIKEELQQIMKKARPSFNEGHCAEGMYMTAEGHCMEGIRPGTPMGGPVPEDPYGRMREGHCAEGMYMTAEGHCMEMKYEGHCAEGMYMTAEGHCMEAHGGMMHSANEGHCAEGYVMTNEGHCMELDMYSEQQANMSQNTQRGRIRRGVNRPVMGSQR